jgi:UDP-N-acetylmuramoylalanine--D-glutamate ligase
MKSIRDIDLKNTKILIAGLGRSGRAVLDYFLGQGVFPDVYDGADIEIEDVRFFTKIKELGLGAYLNNIKPDKTYNFVILSPGISVNADFVVEQTTGGAIVLSELEMAYQLGVCEFIGITGTNGKTTTTTLVGEIVKAAGIHSRVLGNIGEPAIKHMLDLKKGDIAVAEVSSFQLEASHELRPHIAAILNITPDHLDRHGSIENYASEKFKIGERQGEGDFLIYNADDGNICKNLTKFSSRLLPFSTTRRLETGAYLADGNIFLVKNGKHELVLNVNDIKLKGRHNYENVLAALLISEAAGISRDIAIATIKDFKGVAHRLEMVLKKNGIEFYNDSKGTNTDASMKAIDALGENIILIAGGYDKQADYTRWLDFMRGRVKILIVIGATAEKIMEAAKGISDFEIYKCSDMAGAVRLARELASSGDKILLSPACASWDMYKCFEDRGDDFKAEVLCGS